MLRSARAAAPILLTACAALTSATAAARDSASPVFPADGSLIYTPGHAVGCTASRTDEGFPFVMCIANRGGHAGRYALGISTDAVYVFEVKKDDVRRVNLFRHEARQAGRASEGLEVKGFTKHGARVFLRGTDVACRPARAAGREFVNCDVVRRGASFAFAVSATDAIVLRYDGRTDRPAVVLRKLQA